jgi:hypothetical protein
MNVTQNQIRKRASASNSPGNAIESIVFLVCVVILFLLCDGHVTDRTVQPYKQDNRCRTPTDTEDRGTLYSDLTGMADASLITIGH